MVVIVVAVVVVVIVIVIVVVVIVVAVVVDVFAVAVVAVVFAVTVTAVVVVIIIIAAFVAVIVAVADPDATASELLACSLSLCFSRLVRFFVHASLAGIDCLFSLFPPPPQFFYLTAEAIMERSLLSTRQAFRLCFIV